MIVKIVNKSANQYPEYKHFGDSGMDIRSNKNDFILNPLERCLVPTGLFLDIPLGYEIQVRSRSGLAINNGIMVLNSPGTVDSPYTGEICVILINLSNTPMQINHGDRIAQMVLQKVEHIEWEYVNEINKDTSRNESGFNSTGIK